MAIGIPQRLVALHRITLHMIVPHGIVPHGIVPPEIAIAHEQVQSDAQAGIRLRGTVCAKAQSKQHCTGNGYDLFGIAWQYRWGAGL